MPNWKQCPECGYLVVDTSMPCSSCGAEILASATPPRPSVAPKSYRSVWNVLSVFVLGGLVVVLVFLVSTLAINRIKAARDLSTVAEIDSRIDLTDPVQQFRLGYRHYVEKDYSTAAEWYRKAAEQGYASAQNNLGAMYQNGYGVEKSDRQAVEWYRLAAEQGDAWAQNNLGWMYATGRGVGQSNRQAVEWYRKAAEQGHASAQSNLGWMYANGRGVEKSGRQAVEWYRKAAEQGDAWAQNNLGWMYEMGRGVEKDNDKALEWYRKAAAQGNKYAEDGIKRIAIASSLSPTESRTVATRQQTQTLQQLYNELSKTAPVPFQRCNPNILTLGERIKNIDPILIGKNVVFDNKWLFYIDNGFYTREQFIQWRDDLDRVYDAYADLVGGTPVFGKIVFIDIQPYEKHQRGDLTYGAHAHYRGNVICFNEENCFWLYREIQNGSCSRLSMHELAHIFNAVAWSAEAESVVELFMAYALERVGVRYGYPQSGSSRYELTSGTQHREREYNLALENFKNYNIKTFDYGHGTAYDLYLFGLVDKVGWDAYKKAFRSYQSNAYRATNYRGNPQNVRARDFFDRLAHFSGKGQDVLRSLPDNGRLLDTHFRVTRVQNNRNPVNR